MKVVNWKELRRRVEDENREVRRRRSERNDELVEALKESGKANTSMGRSIMRMGMSGQPRSRIFAEKMAIPKKKR